MNTYKVSFQLVDSPVDESQPGGEIPAEALVGAFRDFPFADEVKRAETVKDGATFPTIIFERQSDGEEIAVWTDNAKRFDLCFTRNGNKRFLNKRSKEDVEAILLRFRTDSVVEICPKKSLWQRLFG